MQGGASLPDPFILPDSVGGLVTFRQPLGLTPRSPAINPAKKTLLLLVGGQSLSANTTPTAFIPLNAGAVDQANIFDGALYSIAGPLLGATLNTTVGSPGYGNIAARIADTLVTNGKFDRVIIGAVSIGSTLIADWATGLHSNRFSVAMARLASRGIIPGMTGLTLACLFDIGETDFSASTSQVSFAASGNTLISNLQATGFNGRIFIPLESAAAQTSNPIRSAQSGLVSGNVFSGGDFDAVTGRTDGVHFSDVGAADAAARVIAAMGASGAPY